MKISISKSLLESYPQSSVELLLDNLLSRIIDEIKSLYNPKNLSILLDKLYSSGSINHKFTYDKYIFHLTKSLIIREYKYSYELMINPLYWIKDLKMPILTLVRMVEFGSLNTPPNGLLRNLFSKYEDYIPELLKDEINLRVLGGNNL